MITECRYCHSKVIIAGTDYKCISCDASVGIRIKNGLLANKELRVLRIKCHHKFDAQWVFGNVSRTEVYRLNKNKHFGQMDTEDCLKYLQET